MDLYNNETNFSSSSVTFYCSYAPPWELGGSSFNLVIGVITVMTSFPVVFLNAFIILAIKQRKELQKSSNIMLSSMAVTDLLVGAIVMPVYASIDFFSVSQVSFEHTCWLFAVKLFFLPLLTTATLHHLTVIAWERYVAIEKWMDYKLIITNGRLQKIAVGTWLSSLFPVVPSIITTNDRILKTFFSVWFSVEIVCPFLIVFFYRKVYIGIRNRKLKEISQIDVLMKVKLESKVAKTTGFLTAAVMLFYIPIFLLSFFGKVPRLSQMVTQLNSLFNPLLYCYRDHRFRSAILELLGVRKPQAISSAVGNNQLVKKKDTFRSPGMLKVGKCTQRLTRSASCTQTDALYSIHRTAKVTMLKKSLSAPTLNTGSSSLDSLDPQQPLASVEISVTLYAESNSKSKARFDIPKGNNDSTK